MSLKTQVKEMKRMKELIRADNGPSPSAGKKIPTEFFKRKTTPKCLPSTRLRDHKRN